MTYRDEVEEAERWARVRAILSRLEAVTIATPGEVPWNTMGTEDRSRVCPTCTNKVYDLTELSAVAAAVLSAAGDTFALVPHECECPSTGATSDRARSPMGIR
jgi:rubredoxin